MSVDLARVPVASRADAIAFLAGLGDVMAELAGVLAAETAHLAAGRIRAGLSEDNRKAALAAAYLQGLEHAKRHAVALARHAPVEVKALREASGRFANEVSRNQAVIATVRAVSEGLVRGLGADMSRRSRPSGYGPAAAPAASARSPSAPLLVSARF